MTRKEFSAKIMDMGGTYADVNRLEEEGYENAMTAHDFMREELGETKFSAFCYDMGRDFVIDNMGDLFSLEHPENAKQQRKINRWNYLMRNIHNIGMLLCDYAGSNEFEADSVTWGDIAVAESILQNLKDVCEIANIKVSEI